MPPIRWLSLDSVLMLQELQIQEFGGASGIRDRAMLESALARPQNKEAFGEKRSSRRSGILGNEWLDFASSRRRCDSHYSFTRCWQSDR
ncbi:MAG: hypothetical protein ACFBZ9_04760 [Sphingomonadales bacterium]